MAFEGCTLKVRLVHGVAWDAQLSDLVSRLIVPTAFAAAPDAGHQHSTN